MLGYSLRIDYDTSPLFAQLDADKKQDYPKEKRPSAINVIGGEDDSSLIKANDPKQQSASVTKDSAKKANSCLNFIQIYSPHHPELRYATAYLNEFKDYSKRIFTSPEVETGNDSEYFKVKYKNSYIYSIKGLNKLDNYFVEYKGEESVKDQECLELTLGEDIRMYVYRMFYIYRNLIWSYNMGKKLIPENLLRFNLYIKVSDMRSYTSELGDDFKDIVKNGYSRIIYELKDCEFIFPEDENLLPETLNIGGKEINEELAEMKMKIKYRKVNRIFYSNFFNPDKTGTIIGDKFFTPDKFKYYDDLKSMKYAPENTIKRNATNNNIPVVQSIATRLDTLKNKGLLNEDNNDTALTRFTKSVGNKAIKAGATVLDDKMQQIKTGINDLGKNVFNNNLSSSVRDLLKDKVQNKSQILGKSLHLNTGKQFSDSNEVINFSSTHLPNVKNPKEDLHPNTHFQTKKPAEDLHPTTNFKVTKPSEDLHPNMNFKVTKPAEDLHPDTGFKTNAPAEDLHPTTGFKTIAPVEDLHPDTGFKTPSPNEDLHPDTGFKTTAPSEDLHPDTGFKTPAPNEDLHPDTNFVTPSPSEDLHPDTGFKIPSPNEDLYPNVNEKISSPAEDLHPKVDTNIKAPSEDLHPDAKGKTTSPNEDISGDVNNKITSPNETLHPKSNSGITSPSENLHSKPKSGIQAPNENVNDNFTKFIKKKSDTPPPNTALGDC
jgi:hypothetical protein